MEKDFTIEELRAMLKAKEKEEAEKKKVEEEVKAKKLAAEKEARINEIHEAEKHLNELYRDFLKDYKTLSITRSSEDNNYFWYPFSHKFWF